jgi:hypothetical protein
MLIRALLIASVLALLACGDDGDADDDAKAGSGSGQSDGKRDAAVAHDAAAARDPAGGGKCQQDEMCDYACTEGCEVECLGGRCTAQCPEGGCSLDADFEALAAYDCAGGDCEIDCDGASECSVSCSGGGCTIGCDGDSTCKVSCGTQGDPCKVTCEAGAQASCDNDHCELNGCEPCDPKDIDPSYKVSLDPADYTTTIDNPLYPLPPGAIWKYEAEDELITVEVLKETYTTASGVECVVVHDWSTDRDGVMLEDTRDYFAQDLDGNVWYFGEDTAEYVNGKKANTRGSWEAGKDGALPGVVMYAKTPAIGTQYKEEYDRCEAEDLAELLAVGETVKAPTGEYEDCIRIHDYSAIEPAANEQKLFCPGVGLVLTYELAPGETDPGDPVETLTQFTLPK